MKSTLEHTDNSHHFISIPMGSNLVVWYLCRLEEHAEKQEKKKNYDCIFH